MKKLRTLVSLIALIAMFSSTLFANGLSLNSVGARALGMGGAFIGLADDGSAIYWNPAGLAGLQSRVYLYNTNIAPMGTYQSPLMASAIDMENKMYFTGGAFFNYTMDKMAFGLGVYVPAGLGASWDPNLLGMPTTDIEMMSQIGVISISPAFAYQVTPQFSIGVTVNINYAMFDMKQPAPADINGDGIPDMYAQFEEESTGLGFGATIGLKYDVSKKFSIGATARLASKVSMSGTAKNPLFALQNLPAESEFDRDITWPLWVGGGIAYKPSKRFTFVLDAQFSQWSELEEIPATYEDPTWAFAMGASGNDKFHLNWEDAIQIRTGAEYMINDTWTGRLGYYYDPAPAPDETLIILFPSSTNHVITGGLSYNTCKWSIDAAAEYLLGAERDVAPALHNQPGKHKLDIFAFSVGVGYAL